MNATTEATPSSAERPLPAGIPPEWGTKYRERLDELSQALATYLEPDRIARVRAACDYAADAHSGQTRRSGEPYVFHPMAVARILTDVRFDHETLMAAILHDVIEDTAVTKDDLAGSFGPEVAELVDGVSKLTAIRFSSKQEAQAENFRKMFLAMARDIRVIMVKLADRLHNMRTLGALSPDRRRRIARETLEIYAPIAARLGMNHLRIELENLGFAHLHPMRYRVLAEAMKKRRGNRKEIITQLETRVANRLLEEGIKARVVGREKHLWSLYRKLREKRALEEVYDVYALRIIVENVDTCYRALGLVHGLYKPLMGRFKDYIAIPKANGYQSLHTVLFGPHGLPIEVQVRTYEMHVIAEAGVASHWLYKQPGAQSNSAHVRAREWLQKLIDMQRRAGDSMEFLESVKTDLFPDEVYVFTPRGEIIELPRGATAVDFAYAIHSDVGNTCVGAKIDRRLMPLRTPLSSGQTVEVIIAPTARPNPAWLNFVVTAKARASIRHYLGQLKRDEAAIIGKRLLEQALLGRVSTLAEVPEERKMGLVKEFHVENFTDILADIGLGKRLAALIAKRLQPDDEHRESAPRHPEQPFLIKGTEGTVVTLGRCCRPLPGDPIMGFLSAGRGIVIHRDVCKHIVDYRKNPEKWVEVEWEKDIDGDFPVEIKLDVINRRGVFARVAATIGEVDSNIDHIQTAERDGVTTTMTLLVHVRGRVHLARVMKRLRHLPEVLRLVRS